MVVSNGCPHGVANLDCLKKGRQKCRPFPLLLRSTRMPFRPTADCRQREVVPP